MREGGKSKLKIYIMASEEAKANAEEMLYKSIAKAIYNSEEFQKSILNHQKGIS